jgi:hypothetical protein
MVYPFLKEKREKTRISYIYYDCVSGNLSNVFLVDIFQLYYHCKHPHELILYIANSTI